MKYDKASGTEDVGTEEIQSELSKGKSFEKSSLENLRTELSKTKDRLKTSESRNQELQVS